MNRIDTWVKNIKPIENRFLKWLVMGILGILPLTLIFGTIAIPIIFTNIWGLLAMFPAIAFVKWASLTIYLIQYKLDPKFIGEVFEDLNKKRKEREDRQRRLGLRD